MNSKRAFTHDPPNTTVETDHSNGKYYKLLSKDQNQNKNYF